jgi:hypothetical protein
MSGKPATSAVLALVLFLCTCALTTVVYPILRDEVVRPLSAAGLFALPTLRVCVLLVVRNICWAGFGILALLLIRTLAATDRAGST